MKKLKKIKLNQLNQAEMEDRAMNMLRGGNTCGCGCNGPSGDENNYSSNWDGNLYSPDGNHHCSWPGSGDVTVYGGRKLPVCRNSYLYTRISLNFDPCMF